MLDISCVIHAISGMMLLVVALHMSDRVGIGWWAAADLCFSFGFALLLLDDLNPAWINDLSANALIDGGTALTFVGVARFLRRPLAGLWPLIPALLLDVAEAAHFFKHGSDFYYGTVTEGAVRAWLSAVTAWQLFRRAEPELRPASTFVARLYLIWTGMLLSRMGWWIFLADGSTDPAEADPTTVPALFVRTCLIFLITPAYLWMLLRRLTADVTRQATQDPLTGIANRRLMWRLGEADLPRARRGGRPLAVLMMDIDHFKSINDLWGHKGGDAVLIAAAKAMQGTMRAGETLARIGGEEFLVLLLDTGLDGARASAERLRQAVEGMTVAVPEGEIRCTISIGAAEYRGNGETWEELVLSADKALYQAKEQGRNRVVATVTPLQILTKY